MNQLTRVGASDDYAYDDSGNMVSREAGADTYTYAYDVMNRLTVVAKNGVRRRGTTTTLTAGGCGCGAPGR